MRHVIIFISGIVSALFIRMIIREAEKKNLKLDGDGNIVLKMNKSYDILGYLVIILGVMTAIISQFGAESPRESLIIMLIGLFVILMGVFEIVATRSTKVAAGQAGVKYIRFTGKEKHIPWNEVKEIKYNKFKNSLFIASNTETIKIRMDFVGVRSFINLIKENLPASLYGQALDKCEIQRPRY